MSEMAFAESTPLLHPDGSPLGAVRWGFDEEEGIKDLIVGGLGDLADIDVFHNWVLVWKYIRTRVSVNLIASHETYKSDKWEGVVGLVLKLGPAAFVDDERNKFYGITVKPRDWVLFRNSDGWDKNIQIVNEPRYCECRMIQDAHIVGRVKYPARIY